MTSLHLILWISGGILLQIAIYSCIGFWHHWQSYQGLRNAAAEFDLQVNPDTAPPVTAPSAAWAGLRTFQVERKVVEDAAEQVCSFYLGPEDGKPLAPFLPGQFLTFALAIPSPMGTNQ